MEQRLSFCFIWIPLVESFHGNPTFITIGVPQGSILGPLLFLLYINDIAKISSVLIPLLFADDSNFFLSGESVEDITNLVNIEMDKIVLWLKVDKLLNVKKSKFMVFHNTP